MDRTIAQIARDLNIEEVAAIEYFTEKKASASIDAHTRINEDAVAGLAAQENERRASDEPRISRCPECMRWFDVRNMDNAWGSNNYCDHCFDKRACMAELGGFDMMEPLEDDEEEVRPPFGELW